MDYHLAMAMGHDAADRQMRREGRTTWNIDDWNLAAETVERLYPTEQGAEDARRAACNC